MLDWMYRLIFPSETPDVTQSLVVLLLAISIGFFVGRIKVKGITLGVSAVMFVGLGLGHYGYRINAAILEFVRNFGLILFVYGIGIQVGPSFFSSFKKEGIRFAYHNHGYGLNKVNGVMPLDIIFDQTDPNSVYFEMDIYWTMAGGADPVQLFEKHKGRYKMVHAKDMKESKRFAGDGGDPSQWISLFPYMTSCGEGVFDLPKILTAAKQNGVDHFFVEQDMVQSPEIALKKSADYLKSL